MKSKTNKPGARPTHQVSNLTQGAGMKNLNRAEPRIGLALGQNPQVTNGADPLRFQSNRAKMKKKMGY